jgi:hypothetical protein
MSIRIRERWKGQFGGTYYYVREGNILRRIKDYAISRTTLNKGKHKIAVYEVPIERIWGKTIYEFAFSRVGYFYIRKGDVFAFLDSTTGLPDRDLMEKSELDELANVKIEIRDPMLLKMIEDLKEYYIPMIEEIKQYSESMKFSIIFLGHAQATDTFIEDMNEGLFRCMVLQNDDARLRALEHVMAWIYQLWVTILICKALNIDKFYSPLNPKRGVWVIMERELRAKWWIEQGKSYPSFSARSGSTYYTFFFEPQKHDMAHLTGTSAGRRVHTRPDIIITLDILDELLSPVRLLIECKTKPSKMWEEEVVSQMKEYIKIYEPETALLVSFHKVHASLKKNLESIGAIPFTKVKVIDEVRPKSPAVETLKNIAREVLSLKYSS